MKIKRKKISQAILMICGALLLVCTTIGATLAYLTSTDSVKNTFTVGNIGIILDEAKVNLVGEPLKNDSIVENVVDADRVKTNSYKLLPGLEYVKDPTVTVLANSEECYVRVLVKVTNARNFDEIWTNNANPFGTGIFSGWDLSKWMHVDNQDPQEDNVRVFTLWYTEKVPASIVDTKLPPVFSSFIVPEEIDNIGLAKLENTTISVEAHAIQAAGFKNASEAWNAFDKYY